MPDFLLKTPDTLMDAVEILKVVPGIAILAGGQHIVPRWATTQKPAAILSLKRIPELQTLRLKDDYLHIGASVTLSQLARSVLVNQSFPELASLASKMGDTFMRHRGTAGGAVCTTQIAGCLSAALLGTPAVLRTNLRTLSAHEWYRHSQHHSILRNDELLIRVEIQLPQHASHQSLRLIPGRQALVTVFASKTAGRFHVGVAGLGDTAFSSAKAADWLENGNIHDDAGLGDVFADCGARTDIQAPGEYRRAQAERLLRKAAEVLLG